VITTLNGLGFDSPAALLKAIRSLKPGSQARVALVRDGRMAEITVTIGARPDAR